MLNGKKKKNQVFIELPLLLSVTLNCFKIRSHNEKKQLTTNLYFNLKFDQLYKLYQLNIHLIIRFPLFSGER